MGIVGAVGIIFATPMLWATGSFGGGDGDIKRAAIFLLSGLWLFIGVGYTMGWAVRGFLVRHRESSDEDGDTPARHPPASHGPAGGHPPSRH